MHFFKFLLLSLVMVLFVTLPITADNTINGLSDKLASAKIGGKGNAKELNKAYKIAIKNIKPGESSALSSLVDALQKQGINASVYGEPKLKGGGIDKIVVDNKVYDVLIYFSGPKQWNPAPIYLRENDSVSVKATEEKPGPQKPGLGDKSKIRKEKQAAFMSIKDEIDPTSDNALEQMAEAFRTMGFDADVHQETDGGINDKLLINGKLFDVIIANHPPRRWNPFLIPIKNKKMDAIPKNKQATKQKTVKKTKKTTLKIKDQSDKKINPVGKTKGFQSSFLASAKGIDPAAGNALEQLCKKLQSQGFSAAPWGEPKLKGRPVDKITVNGQVYDVLVFFEGNKRWNPCAVPLDR